ncbi:CDGSH iron-sulfur domain-containing protein 1 [Centruroides vittatus]|uniref:CDGSH iron-sulfur domain-containing protein 1 n=1 Tax=Centruroides vittatus TaxID=120091 RepID=UPI00350F7D3C
MVSGLATVSWRDWVPVLSVISTCSALGYAIYVTFKLSKKGDIINKSIDKKCEKIVHSFDIEDIGSKTCFCRCWKSEKFPYCDGSHNKHNKETGDNVGPVVVKPKDA